MYTAIVIVKYTLSRDEYVESQCAYRMRMANNRMLFRNLYGLACLTAVLGIYIRLSGFRWWGNALFILAGFLLAERLFLWRLRASTAYSSTQSISEPVELRIEESNLIVTSAGSREIRWADISAGHESKNLFLLKTEANELLAIPKRAFPPGDLSGFKELCQKELIVKITRENPDIVLLRFIVSWGLLAIFFAVFFIGSVHNFLTEFSRGRRSVRSSGVARTIAKSPPVSASELRGQGTVYLVPIGTVESVSVSRLVGEFEKRYGLQLHLLPAIPAPSWAKNVSRKQYAAEDLITAMKLTYAKETAEPDASVIGITDEDMYISAYSWSYAFSFRSEDRFAVISSAHLAEAEDGDAKPVAPDVVQKRATKVLIRDVGILHYRLQPSNHYESVLYSDVDDAAELDDIGDDYLVSDVMVRADWHVSNGEPCFVLRSYTSADRVHPDPGSVTSCSGYYKELNLETVQIDLRYGLLLDQRTDFLVADDIPLELTRVLRTQDGRSRAFGIGGNHNLNIFLVGDKWPFTSIDLVLETGGRSHFRRSNWGFGYWDARYSNSDMGRSMYAGSRIDWAWPGWNLKSGGMTYKFPDPRGANRPEQSALVGIENYKGQQLLLNRDAAGNLLHARSPGGHRLNFQYDQNNRVTEIRDEYGMRFKYSYDGAGHLVQVTDEDQRVTEYHYDESGHINRIVQAGAEVCSLTYDADGRVQSETLSGGRTYGFHYSPAGTGGFSQVEVRDSEGPVRRIRISPLEYTIEVPGQ